MGRKTGLEAGPAGPDWAHCFHCPRLSLAASIIGLLPQPGLSGPVLPRQMAARMPLSSQVVVPCAAPLP